MQTQRNGKNDARFFTTDMRAAVKRLAAEMKDIVLRQAGLKEKLIDVDPATDAEVPAQVQSIVDEIKALSDKLKGKEADALRLGVLEMAQATYDAIHPYVQIAEQASGPIATETARMIRILYGFIISLHVELRPDRAKAYADAAWSRKAKLDAYVGAGFDRSEAMAMVLAEIKPPDYGALANGLGKVVSPPKKRGRKVARGKVKTGRASPPTAS